MVTADYHDPDWGCFVDFFAIRGWKIAGMGDEGLNPQPLILVLSQVHMTYFPATTIPNGNVLGWKFGLRIELPDGSIPGINFWPQAGKKIKKLKSQPKRPVMHLLKRCPGLSKYQCTICSWILMVWCFKVTYRFGGVFDLALTISLLILSPAGNQGLSLKNKKYKTFIFESLIFNQNEE